VTALLWGGLVGAAAWRLILLGVGLASLSTHGLKTGGLIGYIELHEIIWGWWLGVALLFSMVIAVRHVWNQIAWICSVVLIWGLFVNLSAGSPPYPIQAVSPGPAVTIHSIGYSAAGALLKLPWEIHYDNELYPSGTTLNIPPLGLRLAWPEGTWPWWLWLQIPYFGVALLLPLVLMNLAGPHKRRATPAVEPQQ